MASTFVVTKLGFVTRCFSTLFRCVYDHLKGRKEHFIVALNTYIALSLAWRLLGGWA